MDENALEKFCKFLSIKTMSAEGPNGSYQEAVDFLIQYGKEYGLTEHKVIELVPKKPILIITWKGSSPNLKSIILNSHYDVVPYEKDKWASDAFEPLTKDGKVYARGTQDMKSVCIQYMEAVGRTKLLVEQGKLEQPKRTIHLVYLPDEEIGGGDGAAKFIKSEHFTNLNGAVALDEGLANPNNAYTVYYGERTPWWVKVTAKGPAGHGSQFIKRAAIEKLTDVMCKVYKFRAEQEARLHDGGGCNHAKAKTLGDVVTLNITGVKGYSEGPKQFDGFAINVVPTSAFFAMDIRIPPSFPLEDMEKILAEWTAEEDLNYEFYTKMPSHYVTPIGDDNIWWVTLKNAIEKSGVKVEAEVFPAATDSRFYRSIGLPCFGFSPMRNTPILLHNHNEFLEEKVFLEGIKVFQQIIEDLAGVQN